MSFKQFDFIVATADIHITTVMKSFCAEAHHAKRLPCTNQHTDVLLRCLCISAIQVIRTAILLWFLALHFSMSTR